MKPIHVCGGHRTTCRTISSIPTQGACDGAQVIRAGSLHLHPLGHLGSLAFRECKGDKIIMWIFYTGKEVRSGICIPFASYLWPDPLISVHQNSPNSISSSIISFWKSPNASSDNVTRIKNFLGISEFRYFYSVLILIYHSSRKN